MRRPSWPRASGANPPIKTPKRAADTSLHLREVQESEVWTACGSETTFTGVRTTYATADVTCDRCCAILERRRDAMRGA